MDDAVRAALEQDELVDFTTTGRVTGKPHRIEINLHYFSPDEIYLTGLPRPRQRDWYRNLVAKPQMTLHLKQSTQADLPGDGHADHRPGAAARGLDPAAGTDESPAERVGRLGGDESAGAVEAG